MLPLSERMLSPDAGFIIEDYAEEVAQLEAENERLSDVDKIAQTIRIVDGENKLGAGALAEAIVDALKETTMTNKEKTTVGSMCPGSTIPINFFPPQGTFIGLTGPEDTCPSTHGGAGYAEGSYRDDGAIVCGICKYRIENPAPTGGRWVPAEGFINRLLGRGEWVHDCYPDFIPSKKPKEKVEECNE